MIKILNRRILAWLLLLPLAWALLYTYNLNAPPLQTSLQLEYEKWLKQNTKLLLNNKSNSLQVTVRLSSADPAASFEWEMSNYSHVADGGRLLRILNLIKRANLFSAGTHLFRKKRDTPITLTVTAPNRSFETKLTKEDLLTAPAGKVFLKLFELYAGQPHIRKENA